MPFEGFEDFRRYVFRLIPMLVIPFLKDGNWRTGDLDIQLDVVSKARKCEV